MQVLPQEKEIISEFEIFDNWMEKYEYLIDLGKDLPIIESLLVKFDPCKEYLKSFLGVKSNKYSIEPIG